jgi:hypothetical protein
MTTRILNSIPFVLAIIALTAGLINAQPDTLWTQTFGGNSSDEGHSVLQTSDDGYLIAGNTYSYGSGGADVWLIKTDASGNAQWNQTLGGNITDEGHSVQQTSDGGFIVAGFTWSYGAGGLDVYLAKTDVSGNLEWQQAFGGSADDYGYSVQQTSDGGYIVAGYTFSYGAGGSDFYLIKTDATGNELWSQTFGGNSSDDGYSVQQTSDGGYIITGVTFSYGAGGLDVYLVKTDTNGNELWNQTYGGSSDDRGWSVQQTSDGGYIIAGNTNSYGAGGDDVYLIKIDATGNELWSQTFGGSSADRGYSVQQTSDGGYIITGDTWSYGAGGSDVYIIRTDASGIGQWDQIIGGNDNDYGNDVKQTTDGGYIIVGDTWSPSGGYVSDVWLIRLEGETTPPDVIVTLTPYNPPIQIPAGGGSFDFNIEVTNNIPMGFEVDVWTMATLPNGSQFGPIINVDAFPLSGSSSVNRDRTQMVPANAPTGNYTYDAYVGTYPNDIWDEDHFDFEKLAGDGGSNISGWECWGEPFTEQMVQEDATPDESSLVNAYPNPFNPTTVLSYQLQAASIVRLIIYDVTGRQVAELVNGWRDSGVHEVMFDGSGLVSGIYVYRLDAGEFSAVRKMVLIK